MRTAALGTLEVAGQAPLAARRHSRVLTHMHTHTRLTRFLTLGALTVILQAAARFSTHPQGCCPLQATATGLLASHQRQAGRLAPVHSREALSLHTATVLVVIPAPPVPP
jgi:hypothetical protein